MGVNGYVAVMVALAVLSPACGVSTSEVESMIQTSLAEVELREGPPGPRGPQGIPGPKGMTGEVVLAYSEVDYLLDLMDGRIASEIKSLRAELKDTIRDEVDSEIDWELEDLCSPLTIYLTPLCSEIDSIRTEMDNLDYRVSSLESDIFWIREYIDDLESEIDSIRTE